MIRIKNSEYVKSAGDFKIDGLHVKRLHFDLTAQDNSAESLVVEMIPFATMDNGAKVFDHNKVYKIYIPNLQQYIIDGGDQSIVAAYFATEQAITHLLNDKHPELQAKFEAPQ